MLETMLYKFIFLHTITLLTILVIVSAKGRTITIIIIIGADKNGSVRRGWGEGDIQKTVDPWELAGCHTIPCTPQSPR